MKLFSLIIFSLFSYQTIAASCCVSNTSVSNLMILPADWQQTFTVSQSRVIGDTDHKGKSIFRGKDNQDILTLAKLELAYGWSRKYQTGISLRYQNRERKLNGTEANDSGWSDVGISHAYQPKAVQRIWIYQTLNIPTAASIHEARGLMAVDGHGTGTYLTSIGAFGIKNFTEWDVTMNAEVHRAFGRTFKDRDSTTEVRGFWGTSVSAGVGYIPWRSKSRYGLSLTPRLEGSKDVKKDGDVFKGKQSLVWDTAVNYTYTLNAQYAFGVVYLDQTIFGPASNTLLNRSLSLLLQSRF